MKEPHWLQHQVISPGVSNHRLRRSWGPQPASLTGPRDVTLLVKVLKFFQLSSTEHLYSTYSRYRYEITLCNEAVVWWSCAKHARTTLIYLHWNWQNAQEVFLFMRPNFILDSIVWWNLTILETKLMNFNDSFYWYRAYFIYDEWNCTTITCRKTSPIEAVLINQRYRNKNNPIWLTSESDPVRNSPTVWVMEMISQPIHWATCPQASNWTHPPNRRTLQPNL